MAPKQDVTNSFNKEEGVIHIGGIDALVRLTLDQVRTDARRGLKTGMFISGYRGSPVGMLDAALLKQQKLLVEHNIKFVDGINEDLAATAVWGTPKCCILWATRNSMASPACGTARRPAWTAAAMRSSMPTTLASTRTEASSP